MPHSQLSLREKKYAKQKLKILDTLSEKLKEKSLADISVKEIVREIEISEMTFFNYFGSKGEVLVYFIELWNLEMQIKIQETELDSPMEAIYLIFEETAKQIELNYQLFMEIVASMALYGLAKKDIEISKAEKILRFGKDVAFEIGGFKELILPLLEEAKIAKDKQPFIYTALYNTCFATPLLMKCPEFGELKDCYFEQIDYILKGIVHD